MNFGPNELKFGQNAYFICIKLWLSGQDEAQKMSKIQPPYCGRLLFSTDVKVKFIIILDNKTQNQFEDIVLSF